MPGTLLPSGWREPAVRVGAALAPAPTTRGSLASPLRLQSAGRQSAPRWPHAPPPRLCHSRQSHAQPGAAQRGGPAGLRTRRDGQNPDRSRPVRGLPSPWTRLVRLLREPRRRQQHVSPLFPFISTRPARAAPWPPGRTHEPGPCQDGRARASGELPGAWGAAPRESRGRKDRLLRLLRSAQHESVHGSFWTRPEDPQAVSSL